MPIKKEYAYSWTPSTYWGTTQWCKNMPANPNMNGYSYTAGTLAFSQSNDFRSLGKGHTRIGGDFRVDKRQYSESTPFGGRTHLSNTSDPYRCQPPHFYGSIHARFGKVYDSHFEMPTRSSNLYLDSLGTTAIARVKPTNPIGNLSGALIELRRDGVPDIPGLRSLRGRALTAKNAGSEYLNVEFGWKPLISDVQKLLYAVKNFNKVVRQYRKDSGKLLERQYEFDTEVLEDTTVSVGNQPLNGRNELMQFVKTRNGTTTKSVYHTRRRWFKGVFKFYLPPEGSLAEYEALANKLLGTRITPETLWNAAPWTWALDWFSNSGDYISNVSSFQQDGLVMPWGYVMEECVRTVTYTSPGWVFYSWPGEYSFSQTFRGITRTRRTATPYGFGLNIGDLSDRQWAILTALGVSRRK